MDAFEASPKPSRCYGLFAVPTTVVELLQIDTWLDGCAQIPFNFPFIVYDLMQKVHFCYAYVCLGYQYPVGYYIGKEHYSV